MWEELRVRCAVAPHRFVLSRRLLFLTAVDPSVLRVPALAQGVQRDSWTSCASVHGCACCSVWRHWRWTGQQQCQQPSKAIVASMLLLASIRKQEPGKAWTVLFGQPSAHSAASRCNRLTSVDFLLLHLSAPFGSLSGRVCAFAPSALSGTRASNTRVLLRHI